MAFIAISRLTVKSVLVQTKGAIMQEDHNEHDVVNNEVGFRFVRALAVEKAVLDPRLKPSDSKVLAAISYFMNGRTKRAWPSYERIAEITGYSEDGIDRSIRNLKRAGYLFTERKAPITGGRALVHYGLSTVRLTDLNEMVTAAVIELRRSKTLQLADPARNSGVRLTPTKRAESKADPAVFRPSDPAVFYRQELTTDEPIVEEVVERARDLSVYSDDQLDELHQLCSKWGQKPNAITFNEIDRPTSDRMIAGEIDACRRRHPGIDDAHTRSAALVALNTLRGTRATGTNGASSALKLFRSAIDSEIARETRPPLVPAPTQQRGGRTSTVGLARMAWPSSREG
jgi:hypothetical protein